MGAGWLLNDNVKLKLIMIKALTQSVTKTRQELTEVENLLQHPDTFNDPKKLANLSRRHSELKDILEVAEKLNNIEKEINELNNTLKENDAELITLAQDELPILLKQQEELTQQLAAALTPPDPDDNKGIVLEIRAGTGGDEAGLFAAELLRAYLRYAERKGWKTNLISKSDTNLGGIKEAIVEINGVGVFKALKYESGVHRVQRIPDTEKSGRVHTSTVTVAVLPQAEDVDLKIKPEELKVEATTSSGHGGQSVNTTYSAIRITHLPTGLMVQCQDERSQTQNKEKAMRVLRARLLALARDQAAKQRADLRRGQVGTGERAEKIRTYNFPQDRCTDHRGGFTTHGLAGIMDGDLDKIIQTLQAYASGLSDVNPASED